MIGSLVGRWGVIASLLLSVAAAAQEPAFDAARAGMVREIETDVRLTAHAIGRKELDPRVMAVMGRVPRHRFVPDSLHAFAYANRPLPIGHGQTISQPYIVALMTDLLDPQPDDVLLEVGTGSGYQAAVLAPLVRQVHTIEIIPALATSAARKLQEAGFGNVRVYQQDGYFGLPDAAPFDGIIVTAAAGHIPPPLVRQLRPGARMIIPVGDRFSVQHLVLVEKHTDATITTRQVLPVRFVPLTGGH